MRLLHIYGQSYWHTPAYIVGNTAALMELQKAITQALEGEEGYACVIASDGESYDVRIKKDDGDWGKKAVPYVDEIAEETRKMAIWPWTKGGNK